jgi:predicted aconitase with swiveling domain
MAVTRELWGRVIVAGAGSGRAAVSSEPLSLWGGLNPSTGEVIDRRHPLSGRIISGNVLVIPHGRGSCSASGVLLEAIRNGTAPSGIVVSRVDPIIGLGAILGDELYGLPVPVIALEPDVWATVADESRIEIRSDGAVLVDSSPPMRGWSRRRARDDRPASNR